MARAVPSSLTSATGRWRLKKIAVLIAATIFLVLSAKLFSEGSMTNVFLAFVVGLSPVAIYFALRRPLLFPYAFYALIVPIDEFIDLGQLGNLSRLIAILSAFLIVIWLLRTKTLLKPSRAVFVWAGLTIWVAASGFWAISSDVWWPAFSTFLQLFVLYALVALAPADEADVRAVLVAVAIGGSASACYVLAQFSVGSHLYHDRVLIRSTTEGFQHVFDANHMSASLLLPLAIVMMVALRTRRALVKAALAVIVALLIGALFVLASRGAFLGLAVLLIYYGWKSKHRAQLLVLPVLALPGLIPASGYLLNRLQTAVSSGGAGRSSIWAIGLQAFKHNWLVGSGYGNSANAFNKFFFEAYQAEPYVWDINSHSVIILAAVELGVIGLVLVLLAWYTQFRVLRDIRPGDRLYDLRLTLEGAALAVFTASLFLDLLNKKYAWILFGILALAQTLAARSSSVAARRPLYVREASGNIPSNSAVATNGASTGPQVVFGKLGER